MDRRRFLLTSLAGAAGQPLAGEALQTTKLHRVGILFPYVEADPLNEEMRQAFRDLGYVEGRTVTIEWRWVGRDTARLPALAAELAQLELAAIIAIGDRAIRAARQATTTTPIIAGSDDLMGEGHVASLARPGGRVTGVSILASELNAKRLEMLKAAVPTASRVTALWDPATGAFHLASLETVARKLDVALRIEEVRSLEDLKRAFESARAWRAEAVNVLASPLLHALRQPIIDHAARNRLPAIYQWEESATAGGLMSYGPSRRDVFRGIVVQLDRVLKGAKPADVPVEQPTKFELAINLKTAKALGLTIPPSLLARADQIIE
jgi:putative tryptophan/tyrosine transport system substrate-binding protein